jgi:hypothetical protein
MVNLTKATIGWILLALYAKGFWIVVPQLGPEVSAIVNYFRFFSNLLFLFPLALVRPMVFGLVGHGIFLITRYLTRAVFCPSSRDGPKRTVPEQQ